MAVKAKMGLKICEIALLVIHFVLCHFVEFR